MRYAAKKLFTLIITLFIVSLLAFLAFQIIPGDPTTAMLGTEASPEARAELRAQLGLDQPAPVRYWEWLTGFLTGDFGTSYSYRLSVREMLGEKLVITGFLTLLSFSFTIVLSIPLGILAGSVRSRGLDRLIAALDQVVMSVPPFFVGILACYLFGIVLRLFTPGDFVSYTQDWGAFLAYLVLPALSMALPRVAMTVKMLRGSVLSQLGEDYVRTARAKGVAERTVIWKHALKNALLPMVTSIGMRFGCLLAGMVTTEQLFSIPGVGSLIVESISTKDEPMIIGCAVMVSICFTLLMIGVDVIYAFIDPRIRAKYSKGG